MRLQHGRHLSGGATDDKPQKTKASMNTRVNPNPERLGCGFRLYHGVQSDLPGVKRANVVDATRAKQSAKVFGMFNL